jgi:hypothetical protein
MGHPDERFLDSHLSVWGTEPADPPEPRWQQALGSWQRWAEALRRKRAAPAPLSPHERSSGELTTLPEGGRGQALRQAHRVLRLYMRRQRDLRRVLPHLYFVERALARQGSLALHTMPVWVMQRGLQQLGRLPADDLDDRAQLAVLRQRLVEAIDSRSRHAAMAHAAPDALDSFNGGLDSPPSERGALSTGPMGLEVSEVPRSVYDDLTQGRLPSRDDAANAPGWRKR